MSAQDYIIKMSREVTIDFSLLRTGFAIRERDIERGNPPRGLDKAMIQRILKILRDVDSEVVKLELHIKHLAETLAKERGEES